MSNTTETETKSVPLINPDAYPQMIEMMEDNIRRCTASIEHAERLIELLDETDVEFLSQADCDLQIQALGLLINEKEATIATQEAGIAEFKKVS